MSKVPSKYVEKAARVAIDVAFMVEKTHSGITPDYPYLTTLINHSVRIYGYSCDNIREISCGHIRVSLRNVAENSHIVFGWRNFLND